MRGEILPLVATIPVVGDMTPAMSFKMVDLPLPLGPIMPTVSPLLISKEILSRAVKPVLVSSPLRRAGRNL